MNIYHTPPWAAALWGVALLPTGALVITSLRYLMDGAQSFSQKSNFTWGAFGPALLRILCRVVLFFSAVGMFGIVCLIGERDFYWPRIIVLGAYAFIVIFIVRDWLRPPKDLGPPLTPKR